MAKIVCPACGSRLRLIEYEAYSYPVDEDGTVKRSLESSVRVQPKIICGNPGCSREGFPEFESIHNGHHIIRR